MKAEQNHIYISLKTSLSIIHLNMCFIVDSRVRSIKSFSTDSDICPSGIRLQFCVRYIEILCNT